MYQIITGRVINNRSAITSLGCEYLAVTDTEVGGDRVVVGKIVAHHTHVGRILLY